MLYDKGFIYVLRGKTSGNYKIGLTLSVANRARELAYDAGESIEVLAAFPGTVAEERLLLNRVHRHRIVVAGNSEWMRPHPDVLALVGSLPTGTRISYSVDVVKRAVRKPRRTSEQVLQEREAAYFARHGHSKNGPRPADCRACKRLLAAGDRASRVPPRPSAWSRLNGTLKAHCAKAPTLTGGA